MNHIQIKSTPAMEYTLISNCFIDFFLAGANDVQLKVYLFLLRHLPEGSVSDLSVMADLFNYSEKDILRALSYWEKKGLLSLSFDVEKNVTGISLLPATDSEKAAPVMKDISSSSTSLEASAVSPVPSPALPGKEPQIPQKKTFIKPEYTLDQLAKFQENDSASQVLFIAESYLGKTLSSGDIRSLLFISDELGFSFDLVDHLLQYCIDRGKKDFRYIEKVAVTWAENNIATPEEAASFSSRYNKDVYAVMNALGKNNLPTPKEADFIKRWYQIYGFSSDIVLEACERTVLATDRHRFEYADKILSNWKNAGVHHKPDIDRIDAGFNKTKKQTPPPKPTNKFNQFQQNDYDFDLLERELLHN